MDMGAGTNNGLSFSQRLPSAGSFFLFSLISFSNDYLCLFFCVVS
jgi:hypothetical protein